jgi:hypothetical protein
MGKIQPSDDLPVILIRRMGKMERLLEEGEVLLLGREATSARAIQQLFLRAKSVAIGVQDKLTEGGAGAGKRSLDGARSQLQKARFRFLEAGSALDNGHESKAHFQHLWLRQHLHNVLAFLWTAFCQLFDWGNPNQDRFADPWDPWQDTGGEGGV